MKKLSLYFLLACFCARTTPSSFSAEENSGEAAALAQQAQNKLQQASSREDFQDAAELLKKAAKADPENMDVRQTLGWVYLDKLHEPQKAYPYLAKVAKRRPTDVNARKLLAMACSQTGRVRQAVREFRAASLLQPDDLWIMANLARALARDGQWSQADKMYAEILKTDPANPDARLGQAELAAWRGHSAGPLETLQALSKENPTNVEVLALMGDVHRWDWDLTDARQDYQQALGLENHYYAAAEGLREANQAGASELSVKGYRFKDTTEFLREYLEVGTRIHLSDRAYLLGKATGWRFTNPGLDELDRADGDVGLEYHWARWLETSLEGQIFNYENRGAIYGGQFSSKLSPATGFDIYTVLSYNQPFISSIASTYNGTRQDSIGNGLDFQLGRGFSIQNDLQLARLSDHNTWWEEKPQLSYRLLGKPATFIRAQYDYLDYGQANTNYWSPMKRHVASPVFDTTIPLGKSIHIAFDARAPYVFDAHKFGYQFEGGPTIDFSSHVQLSGSYIYASIPADPGVVTATGSSRPPWSGNGWQAQLRIRF